MFLPVGAEIPRLRFAKATVVLVIACVTVYAFEQGLGPLELVRFARSAGVVPWEIAHLQDLVDSVQPRDVVPPPLTILTSMFVHGDLVHLLGNVWFLWLFGSRLEPLLGWRRFLACYALAGTAAALLQVWADPSSTMPMIGASGAIAGVLGAFALHFPRERVRCLVLVICFVTSVSLPARLILGLWLLGQVVAAGGHGAGVAFYAHIGGFLAGLLIARFVIRPPRGLPVAYDSPREPQAEAGRRRARPAPLGAHPPLPST